MNWDAIGALGEILGALAVLITLVYLGRQIKQNTQEVRSSNYHGITDSFNALNVVVATNSEVARIFEAGNLSYSNMPADDQTQYAYLLHAGLRVWDVLYYQSHNGTGDKTLWDAEKQSLENFLRPQGARDWWRSRPFKFSADFESYVESVVIPNIESTR